ncbi:ArsR/SmtB family transcription factor [Bacillus spongiae]|uniref:ArsR/SmtB family transcription factor n=1 Tax=Bacillus spongiae TaxID=2683610 RepID=UPI003AF50965
MEKKIPLENTSMEQTFLTYEMKFKALADRKRLHILDVLTQNGEMCVCDLAPIVHMTQSKLSYHLKILLDANIIIRETRGTWSYYQINRNEFDHLFSEDLLRLFKSNPDTGYRTENSCCGPNVDTKSYNGSSCCNKA